MKPRKTVDAGNEPKAPNTGKDTARLSSLIFASRVISLAINGLGLVAITRILGPTEYGVYILALAVAGTIGAFQDFGIGNSMLKFCSEYIVKKKFGLVRSAFYTASILVAALTCVLTAITIFAGPFIAQDLLHNAAYSLPIQVGAFFIIGGALYTISYDALIGIGRGKRLAIVTILQAAIQVALSVLLALEGYGALAPLLGATVSFFAVFAVTIVSISRFTRAQSAQNQSFRYISRRILSFSAPLGFSNGVHSMVVNFAPAFMAAFADAAVIGNYGIASKVVSIFELIYISIGLAVLPMFSATLASKSKKRHISKYYNYSIYISTLFATPAVIYLIILSQQFSYTAFGGAYKLAPEYISIISIGVLFNIIYGSTYSLIASTGKTRRIMKYTLLMAASDIILLPVLVPTFTGAGLAIILFVSEPLIGSILLVRYVAQSLAMRLDLRKLGKVIASGIFSGVLIIPLALLLSTQSILLLVAAFIEQLLAYPAMLVLFGGLRTDDISLLIGMVGGMAVVGPFVHAMAGYVNAIIKARALIR